MWRILAVVAETNLRGQLSEVLKEAGLVVFFSNGVAEASQRLKAEQFQALIVDGQLEGLNAEAINELTHAAGEDLQQILLLDSASQSESFAPLLPGWLLLNKPARKSTLLEAIRLYREKAHLPRTIDYLRHTQPYIYNFSNIIAESPEMKEVLELVRKVAASASSVLIQGETGTGKELVAAAIHFNSPRRHENFVAVNCAALHENLLESELFGHEKGAFTSAYKQRIGRFEQADGGTLFLDEIGDMALATQAKVLRVLQQQEFERLGGTKTIHVDVRIIAATNQPLPEMIGRGSFREDLFYRLNVIPLRIPPLRERKADILPLAHFFLDRFRGEVGGREVEFGPQTIEVIREYAWPGNVRELENVIERAVLISSGPRLLPEDLILDRAERRGAPGGRPTEDLNLEHLERWAVEKALAKSGGVQNKAAALLGISKRAMHYKIRKLGLDPARYQK